MRLEKQKNKKQKTKNKKQKRKKKKRRKGYLLISGWKKILKIQNSYKYFFGKIEGCRK